MNITDKIYNEWAWRTKTGTPSMDNVEDKVILDKLIAELTNADGQISKAEVIDAIKKGEFSPEQLRSILNGISGVAYKDDVLSFLNQQGKSVASISKTIYNRMVENGDIQTYHKYIKDGPATYADLGTSGNLKTRFSNLFSEETINFLFNIKPQIGNVATGKGEVLLCALTADVNGDSPSGDVGVGNKGVEVKNRGAIPMGQKAQFGKNTDKKFIQDAIKAVNQQLANPIDPKTKGNRPLHRLNIILAAVAEQESDKVDVSLDAMDAELRNNYPGIDFSDFSLKQYKKGNAIDADAAEQAFSKKVIKLYTETEEFEEIFFLDDKSGNYAIVPASKLVDSVGSKISIHMKDGLPRFSYNF